MNKKFVLLTICLMTSLLQAFEWQNVIRFKRGDILYYSASCGGATIEACWNNAAVVSDQITFEEQNPQAIFNLLAELYEKEQEK